MEKKLLGKANKIFRRQTKTIYQAVLPKKHQQHILFIVGCQRSGTSMLQNIFDRDLNTKCYAEFSTLTRSDSIGGIRLNSLELVKKELDRVKAPLIVLKPLVESQNILELLNYFDNSKAIWMFRNYKDVALSNVEHFGIKNSINDLRAIANREPNNWRSEKTSDHVMKVLLGSFSENMNPYDAAALFWFARNSHYFDLGFDRDPRIILCKYGDIVLEPEKQMRNIYQQIGQRYPIIDITSKVHSRSRQKGRDIELSPEIEKLAQDLQDRLETAYRAKTNQL